MIKTAIVILNWNGLKHLQKFLPGVVKYSDGEKTDIFVADNGSDDGSVDFLKNFNSIKLISFDRNYGYTGGYIKALQQIDADYFVLLNSDVELTPGWLHPLVKYMNDNNSVAACMPKLLNYNCKSRFEYAGASGGFIDLFGYPFCRGRILSYIEEDNGQYDNIKEVFWASGACMIIRKSAYLETGGLDDIFFAHMEEIDLCWRFQRLGYKIVCIPESKIYHVGGGTLPNNTPHKLYLNYRNNLYLLCKNLPKGKLIPLLTLRLGMDVVSGFIYILQGRIGFFRAVFNAHRDFYFKIPVLVKERKKLQKTHQTIVKKNIYIGSVVFDFFFNRSRRKFENLPECRFEN